MSRRKHKPRSPEQIALDRAKERASEREAGKRLEYGVDEIALAMPINADVVVLKDRAGKTQTAHRSDVFDRLLNNDQIRAVRRLESDIAEQMGQMWRPGQRVTVDSSQFPPGQNVSQMQLDAGKRVIQTLALAGARCGWLLHSLIVGVPGKDRADWRSIVLYVTGEQNDHAQASRVRAAADNLVGAYVAMDKAGRVER